MTRRVAVLFMRVKQRCGSWLFQGANISQLERDIGSDQFPPNEHYFGLVNVSAHRPLCNRERQPVNKHEDALWRQCSTRGDSLFMICQLWDIKSAAGMCAVKMPGLISWDECGCALVTGVCVCV